MHANVRTATILAFPSRPGISPGGMRYTSLETQARAWGDNVLVDGWYHQVAADAPTVAPTLRAVGSES